MQWRADEPVVRGILANCEGNSELRTLPRGYHRPILARQIQTLVRQSRRPSDVRRTAFRLTAQVEQDPVTVTPTGHLDQFRQAG